MTTKNEIGEDNITVISSTWNLNNSLVIGIAVNSQGYSNLVLNRQVTFNIAEGSMWEKVESIAKTTGKKDVPDYKQKMGYEFCADKFTLGNFSKARGISVETARIQQCPIQIETTVSEIFIREGFAIVECEIVNILVDEKILHDDSHIDVSKWQPLIYKFRQYVTTEKSLGKNFRFAEH
ncbi:flavin reductase [Actinomyces sp. zg-332]|nr:flavin reductase [Actinomyces sp. zg-332]